MRRRENLNNPRYRRKLNVPYERGTFGRFSEAVARNLGTARFLIIQSIAVAIWVILNVVSVALRWDPYPFILLNLMFSVQAAYAAPLILLAQNRQEDRDRQMAENDRMVAIRTQEDAEYLARELAAVRLILSNVATATDVREAVEALNEKMDRLMPSPPDARRQGSSRQMPSDPSR